jgi:hypothetical protein
MDVDTRIKALLQELRADEYVRFKHGKAIDAALKALEGRQSVDTRAVEAKLVEALEALRGKGGAAIPAAGPKSRRSPAKAKEAAVAHG